jgi:hypothetical protein
MRSHRFPNKRATLRPQLEALEDRTVLDVTLTGTPSWVEQGPAPILNLPSVDAHGNSSAVGAVESIAVHQGSGGHYLVYAGTVNGGIWRSDNITDGMFNGSVDPQTTYWRPLTDSKQSLATASMALDPKDSSGDTLWVGTGGLSAFNPLNNNSIQSIGLLYTRDRGDNWIQLGTDLPSQQIISVVPTKMTDSGVGSGHGGQVVLVAESLNGIYYSDDGGNTFTRDPDVRLQGVPTDLIIDPNNDQRVYAAMQRKSVFQGDFDPSSGAFAWTPIDDKNPNLTGAGDMKLAASQGGTTILYALTTNSQTDNNGLYVANSVTWADLSQPNRSWSALVDLSVPGGFFPSFKAATFSGHLAISVDQVDPYQVYIGGIASGVDVWNPVFKRWGQFANGNPHPDTRHFAFLNSSTLLETDDGGIYGLSLNSDYGWVSLNESLSNTEFFSVAYDAENNVVLGGTQDNGTPMQEGTNLAAPWHEVPGGGGDGGAVAFDDSVGVGYYFDDNQLLYYNRDGDSNPSLLAAPGGPYTFGSGLNLADQFSYLQNAGARDGFFPIALNSYQFADNSQKKVLMLGMTGIYASSDFGNTVINLSPAGMAGNVSAIATGTPTTPDAAYFGTNAGQLFAWSHPDAKFVPMTVPPWGGASARRIVIDPDNYSTAYVLDTSGRVWLTTDAANAFQGNTVDWTNVTYNLGNLTQIPQSLEIYDPTPNDTIGDEVVLVGGLGGVFRLLNPLNPAGGSWSLYGTGLPNVLVTDLHYINGSADILVAGTFGRGAWTVPQASQTLNVPTGLDISGNVIKLVIDSSNPLQPLLDVFVDNSTGIPNLVVPVASLQFVHVTGQGDIPAMEVDDTSAPSAGPINAFSDHIDGFLSVPVNFQSIHSISLNLKGGGGRTADIHGGPTGDTWTLSDAGNGAARLQSAALGETFDVSGLVFLDVLSLDTAGNDTVNVQGVPSPVSPKVQSDLEAINLGSGSNVVNVTPFLGPIPGSLDAIRGSLRVNGGMGTNTLTLNDQATRFASSWDVGGSAVTRMYRPESDGILGPPVTRSVYYTGINNLVINTGTGTNSIELSRIDQNLDKLPTSNTLGAQGSVSINGSGTDTLILDDQKNANASSWSVAFGNVSRSYVTGDSFPVIVTSSINYSGIARLELNAGSGGNKIKLSPTKQNLDELPVTDPFFQITGLVTVNGGGSDALILYDQNNTSPSTWTLTGNIVTRSHNYTIDQFTVTVTSTVVYSGLADLTLNGGPGGNQIAVQNTAAETNTTVNFGLGVDFGYVDGTTGPLTVNTQGSTGSGFNGFEDVFVGAGTDSLSGIQGPLTVNTLGRPGLDYATLALFDQATTAHETYTVTSSEVLRSGAAPIYYRVTNQMEFHLGSGGNLVNIQSTFPGLPEAFVGGLGDDTFLVGDDSNTLNGVQSNLFFQIANAGSQLILQDEGDSANINYTFAHDPAISPYNFVKRSNSGSYIVYSGPLQTVQLLAGNGNDTFTVRMLPPASTAVGLDGGGGTNTLDYSQYVGDIAVNLPLGTATGLTRGISNIQMVYGSVGNDLLVGDGATELLSGGTGRNIIISGTSNAHLFGGGGDNILIGGATNFDQNMDALNDFMIEWLRTDLTFQEHADDIRSGGKSVPRNKPPSVLKGTGFMLNTRTVHDKSSANILTGSSGSGNNWFFWDPADDTLQNKKKGDVFTPIQ